MNETAPGQQAGVVAYPPNSLHKALAQLQGEKVTVFICTRMGLEQRLCELNREAGVES
jgi:hypothetical protein